MSYDNDVRNLVHDALASVAPGRSGVALDAIPNDTAKVDGRFVACARPPHLKLTDQWGNEYEGLVVLPEAGS